jgi:hypothetical protein
VPDLAQLSSRHRSPRWTILLGLSAGLLLTVVVGTVVGVVKTDNHLTARVQDAAEIGGPRLTAHVDGRDAYLAGRGTESDLIHALALTAGIPGLRTVRSEVQIVAARTELDVDPDTGDPSVTVVLDDGRITLRGLVADDGSHASIVAAAEAAVGSDRVRDRLQETRTVRSAEWLDDVAPAIAAMAPFSHVTLAFAGDRILVTGAVATVELKSEVAGALQVAGIDALVDALTVIAPEQPWLSIESGPSGIAMHGLIGREQLQTVMAAIEKTYGAIPVGRDALVLAANSAEVEWPGLVAALIPSTFALDPWSVRAEGGAIALFGVSADPAAPGRIGVVANRFAAGRLTTDLRLTPAAVVAQVGALGLGIDWFEGGTDTLDPWGVMVLDEMALVLFENPEVAIRVVGHAAVSKDIAADREAGLLRASAVRSYLVSRGVDPSRVDAVGSADTVDGGLAPRPITFVLAGTRSEP